MRITLAMVATLCLVFPICWSSALPTEAHDAGKDAAGGVRIVPIGNGPLTSAFECTVDCDLEDGEDEGTVTVPTAGDCLKVCQIACQVEECVFVD